MATSLLSEENGADARTRAYDYASDGERLGQATRLTTPSLQVPQPQSMTSFSYGTTGSGDVEDLEAAADPSSGTPVGRQYQYDPYGTVLNQAALNGDAAQNPFRYGGHYYDTGSDSYDLGARTYTPTTGRYLSQDRYEDASADQGLLADPQTNSRYAYVGGNPVGRMDWDGHEGRDTNSPNGTASQNRPRNGPAAVYRAKRSGNGVATDSTDRNTDTTPPAPAATPPARARRSPLSAPSFGDLEDAARRTAEIAGDATSRSVDVGGDVADYADRSVDAFVGEIDGFTGLPAGQIPTIDQHSDEFATGRTLGQGAMIGASIFPAVRAAAAGTAAATRGALLIRSLFAGRTATTAAVDAAPIANEASAAVNAIRSGIAKSGATKAPRQIGAAGNPGAFPRVAASRSQLESKFNHASDFGVAEPRGTAGFDAFGKAIENFVAAPTTVRSPGRYRGQEAILNFNSGTRQTVVQSPTGEFVTGFRLNPQQLRNVQQRRSLGGG